MLRKLEDAIISCLLASFVLFYLIVSMIEAIR